MGMQLDFMFEPTALMSVDEIYQHATAELLQALKEDRRIERKPAGIHAEQLGSVYITMWANTPDGGLLVVGMEDDGGISGCAHLSQDSLNELERAGYQFCPDAKCVTKRIAAVNLQGGADFLLLIRVYYREDKLVMNNRGEAFNRIGGSKHKLSHAEMRELEADKGQVSLERELCGLHYPDDFDVDAIAKFASRVRTRNEWADDHSTEDILELLHLGKLRNGQMVPNIACALLFARDPTDKFPGCRIRFLRFEGEREGTGEKFNATKDLYIVGTVPNLIVLAEEVLDAQLREFSRVGPDGKFMTAKEYPKLAWYEAVVNACVHRSYGLRNMDIFVKMFDDRLVIESPGGFPPFVTPENIYEVHHPRNPTVMQALSFLDYVKCAHEGTRRIRQTMADMELPAPEFTQTEAGHASVRVTLRNNVKQRKVWIDSDAGRIIGEALFNSLNADERRAVNCAVEDGEVSVSQVQRLTYRTWPSAKKLLVGLVEKGILEHDLREHLDRDPQARFRLAGTSSGSAATRH